MFYWCFSVCDGSIFALSHPVDPSALRRWIWMQPLLCGNLWASSQNSKASGPTLLENKVHIVLVINKVCKKN